MRRSRKLISIMLAGTLVLSMAACGKQGGGNSSGTPSGQTEESNDPYQSGGNTNDPYQSGGNTNDPYQTGANTNDPYQTGKPSDPYQTGANSNDPYQTGAASSGTAAAHPAAEEYVPEPGAGAKYTVTKTADGWLKIENEGGETLGLSPYSGVHLVEEDGFAFKDLNQNGKLDAYEDWRQASEDRAQELVSEMEGHEKARILSHGGWGTPTTEPLAADDGSYTYLHDGGRGGVTRSVPDGAAEHAKWTNQVQAVAESCYYGIPAMISIDPINISGLVEGTAMGSTMDPELAAAIGAETSKQYRAVGVTAYLGPHVDIAAPAMDRAGGTFGEDPQLTLDMTTAYVNAMQSTFDESGADQGWGDESVFCFTKHYGGAGCTEGGRNDHSITGRYTVFPGDNLEAHLITYFDGVFNLPGKTGSSGIMTEYAINIGPDGEPYGGEWAGVYNPYMYGLLEYAGFDSLKITDWGVFSFAGMWGAEELPSEADRIALAWERGANLLGGYGTSTGSQEEVAKAYDVLVQNVGQEEADKIIDHAAYEFILVMMNLNMFDQPYNDSAYAASIVYSDDAKAYGLETQRKSVVMLKNDGTISADGAGKDKPVVYVPYVYNTGFSVAWSSGITQNAPTWKPGMNIDILSKYFTVVTDTVGDPTGEKDAEGKPTYTDQDIVRASAEEVAKCDYVLVGMTNPYMVSLDDYYRGRTEYLTSYLDGVFFDFENDNWYPASLQYGTYTANAARETSLSGLTREDGTKENRSYKGQTAHQVANYEELEALQYANSVAGDIPVIVSMNMDRPIIWSEVEPLADVILVSYGKDAKNAGQKNEVVAEIILGQTEPNGLLVCQQPTSMDEVETQLEDIPRDMKCYVDANGNTYDFAFGLNWSGIIKDARVEKYSAAPISKIKSIDYDAYEKENR